MKTKLQAITIMFCILSCSPMKNMQRIKFNFYNDNKRHDFIVYIPKGYSLQRIKADAEAGVENRYWYSDSSVFYISDFRGGSSLNYSNIREQENAYAKRFEADTITLSGMDKTGKYWKEIKHQGLYYGYSNANADDKVLFDRALSTAKNNE